MILSKPLTICALLGTYLYTNVNGAAYEIQMNGQTIQVNVVSQGGEAYSDRTSWSDDYGVLMDDQKEALCSSLRMDDYCESVTNNGAKTHNLFNYFPNHADESIVAHANDKFNKNTSPYLMKQPMDDRTIDYLSRQNIQTLGTKPIKPKQKASHSASSTVPINQIAQSLLNSAGIGGVGDAADLSHVTTRKFKFNKKNKNKNQNQNNDNQNNENTQNQNQNQNQNQIATSEDITDDEEGEVEVELYSNLEGDRELANALGLDDEEFGETVDRIVAQLVSSYLDNDSDEVDVGQIFANEISVDGNGDVSTEQINLDEGSMQEMSELLTTIANKHRKKEIVDGQEMDENDDNMNGQVKEEHEAQLYEVRYVVDSDRNDNMDDETNEDNDDDDDEYIEDEQINEMQE